MNDIETILSDLADRLSSSGLKLHLKVSEGVVKSRRLWLSHNLDDDQEQLSVLNSPTIPPKLEEQVVRLTGRFGGFIGVVRHGVVTLATTYQHHAKPREDRFGN